MKLFSSLLLIFFSFEMHAQNECDCCNLYLLTDYKKWESYFTPSEIRKNKYSIVNTKYSYLDSNKTSRTRPLATFYFNRRGYINEVHLYDIYDTERWYSSIVFERRFNKRIKSATIKYLDEAGEEISFLSQHTEYSYFKNGVKTRTRYGNRPFLADSIQNNEVLKYNSDGLQISSITQSHFVESSGESELTEIRSELVVNENDRFATKNTYVNDTIAEKEEIRLNEDGRVEEIKQFHPADFSKLIQIISYEYNAEGQWIHIKGVNPTITEIYTECMDMGTYDLYFNFEEELLKSVYYNYSETELKINFSYP